MKLKQSSSNIFYWRGANERVLLSPRGNLVEGVVFLADTVIPIPFYQIYGFDEKALTSEAAFHSFFNDTWLKVNYDRNEQPISIHIHGRLHGGTIGSILLSSTMFVGGVVLTVSTGGAALPLLIGSALTSAGASGAIHSLVKPKDGLSDEFFKECTIAAVSGFISSGAGLCVKGAARKIGEHTAKKNINNIAQSASKLSGEKIVTKAVADLAKIGIHITVDELQQQAIKEVGKNYAEHSASKIIAGTLAGATGKICHRAMKEKKIELRKDIISGGLSGGLSATVSIATTTLSTENPLTSTGQILQKIGTDTTLGAATGILTSVASQMISNRVESKPNLQSLEEAAIAGAAIGAASAFFTSTTASIIATNDQQTAFDKAIIKKARDYLKSIDELLKVKDYYTYMDLQNKSYEGYRKIFSTPDVFNIYIEYVFSKYIIENAGNLSSDQLQLFEDVRKRLSSNYFRNPQTTEQVTDKILGHYENNKGKSALFAAVNAPGITVNGRVVVTNGAYVNGKKLPTVALEGGYIDLSSDLQTLNMIEAYNTAPDIMKPTLAKAVNTALMRSALSVETLRNNHQQVANTIVQHFKSGKTDTVAILTGYVGHVLQVTFIKRGTLIYPIIDNNGDGAQYHYLAYDANHEIQCDPVQLKPFDISNPSEEIALNEYIYNLSHAKKNIRIPSEAFEIIYNSQPSLLNPEKLPSTPLQSVGNCSIYNQQPEAQRRLSEFTGGYEHFLATAKQLLKAARDAARSFSQTSTEVQSPMI